MYSVYSEINTLTLPYSVVYTAPQHSVLQYLSLHINIELSSDRIMCGAKLPEIIDKLAGITLILT